MAGLLSGRALVCGLVMGIIGLWSLGLSDQVLKFQLGSVQVGWPAECSGFGVVGLVRSDSRKSAEGKVQVG